MLKGIKVILHSFLFALFPVLFTYSNNIGIVELPHTYRAIFVTLAVVGLLLLFVFFILRSWQRAGLITSCIVLIFFSYGPLVWFFGDHFPHSPIFSPISLFAISTASLIIFPWLIARVLRNTDWLVLVANITGFTLFATTLFNIGSHEVNSLLRNPVLPVTAQTEQASALVDMRSPDQPKRDIYYIILDGYARQDILKEVHGLDNQAFIDFLNQRGFYVAENSRSNYMQSILSITSSMNYQYLDEVLPIDPQSSDLIPLMNALRTSNIIRYMRNQGYRIITFESSYHLTTIPDTDLFVCSAADYQSAYFEQALLSDSMARVWVKINNDKHYRANMKRRFDQMIKIAEEEGPKFVFAHFIIPHPPFVFARDGSPIDVGGGGTWDGNHFQGTDEEYTFGYREQVMYVNQKIQTIIDYILLNSDPAPVIILQGDHGSRQYLDWFSMEKSCLRECFSILNAYYLPDIGETLLYPSITPVNTFRVVLNTYFNAGLELLDDRYFFSQFGQPYNFQVVQPEALEEPCITR